jgi:hypothetical protein
VVGILRNQLVIRLVYVAACIILLTIKCGKVAVALLIVVTKNLTFVFQKNQTIMKKLFAALLILVAATAQAQTADEIIAKYSAAMGGLDAFTKVTTAKMTGTVTAQSMELPMTVQIVNGKAMRTDVEVMGQSVVNVYNNGTGWKINPYAGAESATEVTGAELLTFKTQASIANNLMDYKSRGHKVELVGPETVEGVKTFKLKLTNKDDGKETFYFISSTDYMLIKGISKREIQGQEYDVESFYSDVKDVNGLKFAMHVEQKIEGQTFQEVKYEKVELNVPVDEKIFKM